MIAHVLHGAKPADPLTFAAVTALLITVGTSASAMPARRAIRIDPMVARRHDYANCETVTFSMLPQRPLLFGGHCDADDAGQVTPPGVHRTSTTARSRVRTRERMPHMHEEQS